MKFNTRRLTDLRVYENNPRSNDSAVEKVKESIIRYGYKVPIVIDSGNIIVAGHTRYAALLQINEESGNYSEITVVVADDLTENQLKQFRIVDNQVATIATWDFTKLRVELEDIEDFILDDFGIIPGFNSDIVIQEDLPEIVSSTIKIVIGTEKIELTEQAYHEWCAYINQRYNMSVIEFVRQRLEIDQLDRNYVRAEL